MQKTDFIARVADETGVSKKTSRQVIEAALDLIASSLASDEKVVLSGFGTFEMRERRERRGVNPQTRQAIDQEIQHLVTEGYERAQALLTSHQAVLEALALQLLEHETLDGAAVKKILEQA